MEVALNQRLGYFMAYSGLFGLIPVNPAPIHSNCCCGSAQSPKNIENERAVMGGLFR
jgi:hypothetical protein